MRALQYFPIIEDPNTRKSLFEVKTYTFINLSVIGFDKYFLLMLGSTTYYDEHRQCKKCQQKQCITCCSF